MILPGDKGMRSGNYEDALFGNRVMIMREVLGRVKSTADYSIRTINTIMPI